MSQAQRIHGARVIVQLVKDMAGRRGMTLRDVIWLPDPAQELPHQSSDTYTLVVTAGPRQAQQRFTGADLEGAHRSEAVRKRIGALVRDPLGALFS